MDGAEILQLMGKSDVLLEKFRGVFSKDAIVFLRPLAPGGFIFNSLPMSQPGPGHWLALYKPEDEELPCTFFDSIGRPPSFYGMMFPEERIVYNDRRLQAPGTDTCALYCILFLYLEFIGTDLFDILKVFSKDTLRNEEVVVEFARDLLSGTLQQ